MNLKALYQETILDHNRNPRNFCVLTDATSQAEGFNPLCGDKLTVYLQIIDDKIINISFLGHGCAISQASASLMTEILINKTIHEAQELFNTFHELLTTEKNDLTNLNKLTVFAGVKEFPARVKCATLAWHTLNAALTKEKKVVSTE